MHRMIVSADIPYAPYDSECGNCLCTRMIVSADMAYVNECVSLRCNWHQLSVRRVSLSIDAFVL